MARDVAIQGGGQSVPVLDVTPDGLRRVTTAELRRMLGQVVTVTANGLRAAAAILAEMEHRGEDVAQFRTGLFSFLPAIAEGRLHAELAIRYAGKLSLLRHMVELPAADQLRVLEAGSVAVVEPIAGRLQEHQVPVLRLSLGQMRQVFRPEGLADGEAQRRQLRGEKRAAAAPAGGKKRPVERVPVSVLMEADEVDILRDLAASRNTSMSSMIYEAVVKAGYLAGK